RFGSPPFLGSNQCSVIISANGRVSTGKSACLPFASFACAIDARFLISNSRPGLPARVVPHGGPKDIRGKGQLTAERAWPGYSTSWSWRQGFARKQASG